MGCDSGVSRFGPFACGHMVGTGYSGRVACTVFPACNDERMTSDDLRIGQAVLEVRYPKAHRYWDDCGKVISQIEEKLTGLVCQRLGPNGFEFEGKDPAAARRAVFYWNRLEITQGHASVGGLDA